MWVKLLVWKVLIITVFLYERTQIKKLPARARRRVWFVYWVIMIAAFWPVAVLIFDLKITSHTQLLENIYQPLISLIKKK